MAQKLYKRRNFVNGSSGGTPLNGTSDSDYSKGNLNIMDAAIDAIDDRVVTLMDSLEDMQTYATTSESWAVGGTDSRDGEDTDNAKYYAERAKTSSTTASTLADTCSAYVTEAKNFADSAEQSAAIAEGINTILYDNVPNRLDIKCDDITVSSAILNPTYTNKKISENFYTLFPTSYEWDKYAYYSEDGETFVKASDDKSIHYQTSDMGIAISNGYIYYKLGIETNSTTNNLLANIEKNYINLGATIWEEGVTYSAGSYAVYEGYMYECETAHTSSSKILPDNKMYWAQINLANITDSLSTRITSLNDNLAKKTSNNFGSAVTLSSGDSVPSDGVVQFYGVLGASAGMIQCYINNIAIEYRQNTSTETPNYLIMFRVNKGDIISYSTANSTSCTIAFRPT